MATEIQWTQSQLDAIEAPCNKILVSAAAGSGKSTVLTQRIITALTAKAAKDIDKLMVVTFTRASAEDLRNKITHALQQSVANDPSNPRLRSQLAALPAARINTIHGTCYTLVKKYFDFLKLPASLAIADENVVTALKLDVMNSFIDYCFSGAFEPIPDFKAFTDNFINERDDELSAFMLMLYDKFKNDPDGFSLKCLDNYTEAPSLFFTSPFGKESMRYLGVVCDYYAKLFEVAIDYFATDEPYAKLCDHFTDEIRYAKTILNGIENGQYDAVTDFIKNLPKPPYFSVKKDEKSEIGEAWRSERNSFRAFLKSVIGEVFDLEDGKFAEISRKTREIAKALILFLKEFDRRFSEAKLRRGSVDFNDLEHYALKLLYDEDSGEISEIAHEISRSLQEIYVDEYQDLNPLQNKIFKALSVECPIFMVGDIKQSIYGFRGADPSAFSEYKKSFPKYSSNSSQKEATVFLSDNFRSVSSVTSVTNAVSDAMFGCSGTDGVFDYRIPYSKQDRLNCNVKTEAKNVTFINAERDMTSAVTKNRNTYYLEAEIIANEIAKLINSGVKSKDIAILLRNTKNSAADYRNALKKRGIGVCTEKGGPLFERPEIQLALCLLNCCDNPYRDIFLAGALKSPVFGVTLDELISIKKYRTNGASLYSALLLYNEACDFEKGKRFVEFLNKMRSFSSANTVDRILWQIFTETNFFTLIYDSGEVNEHEASARRANLLKLHEIAKGYTDAGHLGLYGFLEKIRIMIEQNKSPSSAITDPDGVKLISIHASKGLEFKYCFLAAFSADINKDDLNESLMYDMQLGIALRLKDQKKITKHGTPFRSAIQYKKNLELIDEEMRVLYVALSRAKEKLYICSSKNGLDVFMEKIALRAKISHPFNFNLIPSYLGWIHLALNQPSDISVDYEMRSVTQEEVFSDGFAVHVDNEKLNSLPKLDIIEAEELKKSLKEILSFKYAHTLATHIPAKFSVSRLTPTVLDEDRYLGELVKKAGSKESPIDGFLKDRAVTEASGYVHNEAKALTRDNSPDLDVPSFMKENAQPSGAEKGTATHLFMQFCDLMDLSADRLEAEIDRLVEKRFILESHAKLVNRDAVKRFLSSDIFNDIRSAAYVEREYRFNIKLSAADFTENQAIKDALSDEYLFVQGVIDCYFKDENGNITLVDYKTDYVPTEFRASKESEDRFFKDRYGDQLLYYKKALKILTGKEVQRTVIYSFHLDRSIEI